MPTMNAVIRNEYGTPEAVHVADVERPSPPDGRVLVRVHAAALDRGVWHLMAGLPRIARPAFGIRRPRQPVLGLDVAGVVEEVGPGVDTLRPGDAVFGGGDGTFAEFTVARPRNLATLPDGVTFGQAAALPVSGLTALQALRDKAKLRPGQSVLVIGASGGVGTYAVQIARAMGAEVTGVCSAAKAPLVRSLGAERVLEYEHERLADAGRRFDVVLDLGGNRSVRELRQVVAERGVLLILGGEDGGPWLGGLERQLWVTVLSPFVRQRLGMFVSTLRTADLEAIGAMVADGSVRPVIDREVTFAEVPGAIRDMVEGRVRGKIVVRPPAFWG